MPVDGLARRACRSRLTCRRRLLRVERRGSAAIHPRGSRAHRHPQTAPMQRHKPLRAQHRLSRSPRLRRPPQDPPSRRYRMLERWPLLLRSRLRLLQQPSRPLALGLPRALESERTQRTRAARRQQRFCSTRPRRSAFQRQRARRQARPYRQRGQIPLPAVRPAPTTPTRHLGQQSHSHPTLVRTCASRPAGSCRLRQCRLVADRVYRRSRATRPPRLRPSRRSQRKTRCSLLSPSCGALVAQSMCSLRRARAYQAVWARLASPDWHARRSLTFSSSARTLRTGSLSRRRSQEWTAGRGRLPCRTSSSNSSRRASTGSLNSASPTCTRCPDRRLPILSNSSRRTHGPCRLRCRSRLTWAHRAARRRRQRPCILRRARGPARQIRRCNSNSSSSRATSTRARLRPLPP